MMNEIRIVKSTPEHFLTIAGLENECFSSPWSEEDLLRAMTNPAFVCVSAICDTMVVGYGMMYAAGGESEIVNIAVAPKFRRMGIGEAVMEALFEKAKESGAERMYLEVRESNSAAQALYEKLGFKAIGKRKKYYRNPTEDAVLMAFEF